MPHTGFTFGSYYTPDISLGSSSVNDAYLSQRADMRINGEIIIILNAVILVTGELSVSVSYYQLLLLLTWA